ncbi:GNAT family N-acetyltransferase [Vitreoscilla stercoraria]|uniref:GNAT family N-acetyltransferase n=1 Tax=Vitreoscilla stercoraria TaxID=61 RepID=A0ABY4EAI7_VITST|nr:GNAT family N-acetyltransferase [Vitreoscilla stercoraria]UOO92462.1 GNAT family N-acetyltransferase [Vitreoscilla stercoraria]
MQLRLIEQQDNAAMAAVIRTVSAEYGLGADEGFAVGDSVLDDLHAVYSQAQAAYWVVVDDNQQIVGGGGVAPLRGDDSILEIQKMYFLPQTRGQGLAKQIVQHCFELGRAIGKTQFYLETTANLQAAIALYECMGFEYVNEPLGNTGHSAACEIYMLKTL